MNYHFYVVCILEQHFKYTNNQQMFHQQWHLVQAHTNRTLVIYNMAIVKKQFQQHSQSAHIFSLPVNDVTWSGQWQIERMIGLALASYTRHACP